MRRILVLRPEPGASATAERARDRGLEAVAVPLFEIDAVEWQVPEASGFDGLLLTSANAVRYGGEGLQRLRCLKAHVVGEATAEAAREAGFNVASTGSSGADALIGSIDGGLRLLHLCGADRRAPEGRRQTIVPLVIYRSRVIGAPDLSTAAGSVALVHSPRAGRRFAELVGDRGSIAIAAISPAAAEAVGEGWQAVATAEEPGDDALLALAARLCNNPPPE